MHILVVLDHPNPKSFSSYVASAFVEGAKEAGHTVEVADLHAEQFNPIWQMADIEAGESGIAPPDVLVEQQRIERADGVCFVFPLFWWGMPSMTKGWVDRVWSWGWAYNQLDDRDKSLQRPRSGLWSIACSCRRSFR